MEIKRKAAAHWAGTGKDGNGNLSTQSTVLDHAQYGFNSRFADGIGTNPEELIGAAHAGCFSMKLAFVLQSAGIVPQSIDTGATVAFENGAITRIELVTKVAAEGLTEAALATAATDAKLNCPVSKLLNTEITLQWELL